MREASRVLRLVGSCLAFALSASVLYGALQFSRPPISSPETAGVLLGMGIAAAVAGAMGVFGLTALKGRDGLSGALALVAALLSLPVIIPCLLLLPGGILALMRERPAFERMPAPVRQAPQNAPAPEPPYYGYPPQSYPPPAAPQYGYPPQGYPPPDYPPQGWPPYGQPYPPGQNDTHKEGP
jgi:hypothetical protein